MPMKSKFADQGARLEAALKLSSAVMAIFEWNSDGVLSTLSVDGDLEAVLGFKNWPDLEAGGGLPGLVYGEDRLAVEGLFKELSAGKAASTDLRIVLPDGGLRWIQMEFEPLVGDEGTAPGHFLGTICDITKGKMAAIQEDEQHSLIKALSATTAVLNSALSLEEVLQRILENIAPFIPFELIEIVLLDEDGHPQQRVSKSVMGEDRTALETVNTVDLVRMLEIHGQGKSKKPFWIPDTQSREYNESFPSESQVRSILGTPIFDDDGVVGYLHAFGESPGLFGPEHAERIKLFANQASIAIRKTNLMEEVRRRAAESETLRESITAVVSAHSRMVVLERILEQLALVVPYDTASAGYLVQGGFKIVCARGFGEGDQIVGMTFPVSGNNPSREVYDSHEVVIVPDLREAYASYPHFKEPPHDRILSWMGVPLIFKNSFVGILTLDSGTPNHFSEKHARLTRVYADQVAVALENARLFDDARRQTVESETLRQAIAAVASMLNLDEAIGRILEQVQRVISYQTASVLFREGDEMVLSGSISEILNEKPKGRRFSLLANTPDAAVFRSKKPLMIADLHQGCGYDLDMEIVGNARSLLIVPLLLDGEVIGEIVVNSIVENYFTQDHVRLLMSFAGQAVVAIKNARLYNSLQEELEQRKIMEEELRRLATMDSLTGCLNRRHFGEVAALEHQRSLRYGRQLSLAMLDIDHFKRVNDVYGHAAGDEVLKSFVDICRQNIRTNDLVARMGGEEFVLLLPETDEHEALHLLERLRSQVENSVITVDRQEVNITVSVGIAGLSLVDDEDIEFLLNCADKALYASKEDGRNRVTIWSGG